MDRVRLCRCCSPERPDRPVSLPTPLFSTQTLCYTKQPPPAMPTGTATPRYRTLLPAPLPESVGSDARAGKSTPGRRQVTRIACEPCRIKKMKCDGTRPACNRCVSGDTDCVFDGEPDVTRAMGLKRKNTALQQRLAVFEDIFEMLATRPQAESLAVLQRLRTAFPRGLPDLTALVNLVRSNDILIRPSSPDPSSVLGLTSADPNAFLGQLYVRKTSFGRSSSPSHSTF